MKQFTEKELARAKRARERKLERLKAIVEACKCCWPIDTHRNLHGHAATCPAIAVWQQFKDADDDARADLDA